MMSALRTQVVRDRGPLPLGSIKAARQKILLGKPDDPSARALAGRRKSAERDQLCIGKGIERAERCEEQEL